MTSACLFFCLVAVGLQYSYGLYGIGRNCESTSDCDYSHSRCVKYEECKQGTCGCIPGYVSGTIEGRTLCQRLTKIGEHCDVVKDKCYDGTCLGLCECPRGKQASADKKQCVGLGYGEKCKSKEYNIYDWSTFKCETTKGLRCDDGDTDKCICIDGMKRVDDHCEYYKMGESCDHTAAKASDRKRCEAYLICDSNVCACSSTTKEHTFKMKMNGKEIDYKRCVDKDAVLDLAKTDKCTADYSKKHTEDKADVCGDYLYCNVCVDTANEYLNNTRCITLGEYKPVVEVTTAVPSENDKGGAGSLQTNAVASLGLVLVAFFVMRH